MPLKKAIRSVSQLYPLIDFAKEQGVENHFNGRSDINDVAEAIIDVLDLPSPRRTEMPTSPALATIRIHHLKQDVLRLLEIGRLEYLEEFQGKNISAWALVESALKLAIGFFALHFSEMLKEEDIVKCFRKASDQKSIGPIIGGFLEVERLFRYGELKAEKKRRRRAIEEQLQRIEDANEHRLVQRKLWDEERKKVEEKKQVARKLQSECESYFGRPTPFGQLMLKDYRNWAKLYRNRYAHKTAWEVMRSEEDVREVLDSLDRAEQILKDLRLSRAVPRVVTLLGEGMDYLGRRIVLFLPTELVDPESSIPLSRLEWMYPSAELEFQPFRQVVMLEPDSDPLLNEPLIEPVAYSWEQVAAMVRF